jgi:Tfp pilus assembly protein PilO
VQFYEQAMSRYNQVNEDPKKKHYFEVTLTLVLLIVLLLMIYPAITHILNLNKEIQAGKTVETALENKLIALGQAENNLAEIQAELPLLELALPVGSDIDKYLQKPLESLSNKHGLTIASTQFSDIPVSKPETEAVRVREMNFTISLRGGFPNLLSFVTDLENFVRISNVETLQAKSNGSELQITIQGSTSFLGTQVTVPNQTNQTGASQ